MATRSGTYQPFAGPCTPAQYYAASDPIQAIASSGPACVESLWTWDGTVAALVAPSRVSAAASLLTTRAASLPTTASEIESLLLYLQIAFYHEFYEASLAYDSTTQAAARNAVVAVSGSARFMDETTAMKAIRSQWSVTIDSVGGSHLAVGTLGALLARYRATPSYASLSSERTVVYNVLFTLARQIANHRGEAAASPWYDAITDALHNDIRAVALDTAYTAVTGFLVENALYVAGHFSHLNPTTSARGQSILSDAHGLFPTRSKPWLRAVLDLETFYGARLSNGTLLDVAQIRADVRAIAFPNTWDFDEGRFRFRTPLPRAAVASLHDAIKEVQAGYHRTTGIIEPVPGDQNPGIRLHIYGTRAAYETYHTFLYGLPTNNGGIYIEQDDTLYTYERTPQESIYTLEDLCRHEIVHYYDGRYTVPGSFGDAGSLYDNERLTWYQEGLAEHLVGSTRASGVLPRRDLVTQIASDSQRMTVAEITAARYDSGFEFYRYAANLVGYLAKQKPADFAALIFAVRSGRKAQYDPLVARLAADAALQTGFSAYLSQLVAAPSSTLFAEDVPTVHTPAGLAAGNAAALRALVAASAPAGPARVRLWRDRLLYFGRTSLAVPSTSVERLRVFDSELDRMLVGLAPRAPELLAATAWFGDVRTAGPLAAPAFFIELPFVVPPGDTTPPAAPTGLSLATGGARLRLRWNDNAEPDLAGYHVYAAPAPGDPGARVTQSPIWEPELLVAGEAPDSHFTVTAVDASGNESGRSAEVHATAPVLVVDGYFDAQHPNYAGAWTAALEALGVPYVLWSPFDRGEVPDSVLASFASGVVIWECGYFHSGYPNQLNAARQAALVRYLQAGGNLVFGGAYTSLYLGSANPAPLFRDYLRARHVQTGPSLSGIAGVAGHPVGAGLSLTINAYQSEVDPIGPATSALKYVPGTGTGTISSTGTVATTNESTYNGVPFKAAYLAVPLAHLDATGRQALAQRLLAWMLPGLCAGADADGDGVADSCDACPGGDDLADYDRDGAPDGCDACLLAAGSADADTDGVPDACDLCPGQNDAGRCPGCDGVPYSRKVIDICGVCGGNGVCDECALGIDNCHADANCTDLPTGFSCACKTGFAGNGLACADIDECARDLDDCDPNAVCANSPGRFTCTCRSGYQGTGVTCSDINECLSNTDNCHADALCTNTTGAFTCACKAGFEGDGISCADVDECARDLDNCHADALCTNTRGAFACACRTGYEGTGVACADVDECARNLDNCHADALCTNTPGNFACACRPGFDGNGIACTDVDECAGHIDNCDEHARCANTAGAFTCTCNAGYEGAGTDCVDIDECARGTDDCHARATCTNAPGGFSCACAAGYDGDGTDCADIDECARGLDDCDEHATCANTAGGFSCACAAGYEGTGRTCADIDECARGLDDCDANATCANSAGAFSCACNATFRGDGRICTAIPNDERPKGCGCGTGAIDAVPVALVLALASTVRRRRLARGSIAARRA